MSDEDTSSKINWIVSALFTAGVLLFIIWLYDQPESETSSRSMSIKVKPEIQEHSYSFYDDLPDLQILADDVKKMLHKSGDTLETSTQKIKTLADKQSSRIKQASQDSYYLQTDAFQNAKDADTRRAELILMSYDANIQKAKVNGTTWYRVMVGPFDGEGSMQSAKKSLARLDIKAQPRKIKP